MAQSEHPPFAVLIDRQRILGRIDELARAVDASYRDVPDLLMVSVIEGARTFCGELRSRMTLQPELVEIRARSYLAGTERIGGSVALSGHDGHRLAGRTVLIVEDIVDTGHTVDQLAAHLLAEGAVRVDVVTLLSKPSRREVEVDLAQVGFEIADDFVVGFGMDMDGKYRELPEICVYQVPPSGS